MNADTSERPAGHAGADPGTRHVRVSRRRRQADATRGQLLRAAERLYAEHGLSEVSNRQVAEASGSANNSAVAYHIGTKDDLIAAIADAHSGPIARRMRRMVERARGSADPREHVACLVRPYTDHLAGLGTPSWFARFTAQTVTDPALGEHLFFDPTLTPLVREASDAMWALLPPVPDEVAALRDQMTRILVVHTCAEQERSSAATGVGVDWTLVGNGLVDAVAGVLTAPVEPHPDR